MTALVNALVVLEGEYSHFVKVDACVKRWEAIMGQDKIAALTDAELDAVDSQFGHIAAVQAVQVAEMTVVRLHCNATEKRRDAVRDIASAERDWKLRRFIVRQAWNAER